MRVGWSGALGGELLVRWKCVAEGLHGLAEGGVVFYRYDEVAVTDWPA